MREPRPINRDGDIVRSELRATSHGVGRLGRSVARNGSLLMGSSGQEFVGIPPRPPIWAEITSNPGGADGYSYPWHQLKEDGTNIVDLAGRSGTATNRPAKPIDGNTAVPVGSHVWLVESNQFDGYLFTVGSTPGTGGSGRVLAQIVDKVYLTGDYTRYIWRRAFETDNGLHPITYTFGLQEAAVAYEVNNLDLPVPLIVWLELSAEGDHWLMDEQPDWEFVQKTDVVNSFGYFPGFELRYDQATKTLIPTEDIFILDFNAL